MSGRPRWCSACRKPLKWARTVNNKWIPLNPDPDPDGNQAAFYDATQTLRTRQLGKDQKPYAYERVHMPHVATRTGPQQPQAPVPARPLPPNVISIAAAQKRRANRTSPAPRRGA